MPISKHHSKKGSHSDWKKRSRRFKDANKGALQKEQIKNPVFFRRPKTSKKDGLFTKIAKFFRGGKR